MLKAVRRPFPRFCGNMLIAYEIRSVPGYKGTANQNRCEQETIYSGKIDRERGETSRSL